MNKPARVALFIDYQNTYFTARETFHDPWEPNTAGHITPLTLGELITGRSPYPRELTEVRVYRGQPDSSRDPDGYSANMRQAEAWTRMEKTVLIARTLRYPKEYPKKRPEEKGIDVALAVDFVVMAVRKQYDVGIIMSVDTDLKPALEAVSAIGGRPYPRAEVAAWSAPQQHSRRLSTRDKLWCHWLDESDYQKVRDDQNYSRVGA